MKRFLILGLWLLGVATATAQPASMIGFRVPRPGPVTDPLWSSVKLLVKTVGTSGTSFTDAKNAYTLTPAGNTNVSSDVPFGSEGSMATSSAGGRLTVSTSGVNFNPGTGDWTMECWFKSSLTHPETYNIVFSRAYSGSNYWIVYVNNNGSVDAWAQHTDCHITTGNGYVSANTWTHIAFVRSGSTATVYINGTSRGTASASAVNLNSANTSNPVVGGYNHTTSGQNYGKIYDMRITFAARYTGNFTPPSSPFPTQ